MTRRHKSKDRVRGMAHRRGKYHWGGEMLRHEESDDPALSCEDCGTSEVWDSESRCWVMGCACHDADEEDTEC